MGTIPTELDIFVNPALIVQESVNVVSHLRPKWNLSALKHKIFTAGISNQLIGWYEDSDSEWADMVLVRVFGANTEVLIDRELELLTMQILHAAGECLTEVTCREPEVYRCVCQAMVDLHALNADAYSPSHMQRRFAKEAMLFPKLRHWVKIGPDGFDDPKKQARFEAEVCRKPELFSEVDDLEKQLLPLNSPIVFSHNDILLNNVIYNRKADRALFIDYEYAAYNYEAFDIGNHFCEWAGVDSVNYDLYPSREDQLKWLRCYLRLKQGSEPTEKEVETLYVHANKFALQAANFFWGLWALIQAKYSQIDFDYIDYGITRLKEYFRRKEEFFALKVPA